MPNLSNAADAILCLVEDFESYIDGSVTPDMDSHKCSRDNVIRVQETLAVVRELGTAIEEGDPQNIADIWLRLKPPAGNACSSNLHADKEFDQYQQVVRAAYNDGEHAVQSKEDVPDCGDGLLKFLLVEISEAEDCDSYACAIKRLESAIRQLTSLAGVFKSISLEAGVAL